MIIGGLAAPSLRGSQHKDIASGDSLVGHVVYFFIVAYAVAFSTQLINHWYLKMFADHRHHLLRYIAFHTIPDRLPVTASGNNALAS